MQVLKSQQTGGQLSVHREGGTKTCRRSKRILVDNRMYSLQEGQIVGQGLCIATEPESEGRGHGHLHMGITGHQHILMDLCLFQKHSGQFPGLFSHLFNLIP